MQEYLTSVLIFFLLLGSHHLTGQEINCEELLEYVEEHGDFYDRVDITDLLLEDDSGWIKQVTSYEIDDVIVVIAEFNRDKYGIKTDKYVYCGIPDENWRAFANKFNKPKISYGKKFHKYIINYKCNCK